MPVNSETAAVRKEHIMLSVTKISIGQAGTYYAKDSYYSAERPGEWAGTAADALGLRGEIDGEDWQRVIEGRDPRTGEQLVRAGPNGEHRAATDLTFSAPKSASVIALVLGRTEVTYAHREAIETILKYIEQDGAQARITQDGITEKVQTRNLLMAMYEHSNSRELDPQLHTHCPVINMTRMPDESWKAVSNEIFFENKLLYGQIYRNEFAANLRELGYQIEYGKDGLFEIAGIDKSILEAFSQRSEQIKEAMKELREKYPHANESELREYATLGSRSSKQKNVDMTLVRETWVERINSLGINLDDLNKSIDTIMFSPSQEQNHLTAYEALLAVGKDLPESRFSPEELLRPAAQLTMGYSRIRDLNNATRDLIRSGKIRQNDDSTYSTAEKYQEERETVQIMQDSKAKSAPVMTKEDAQSSLQSRGLTQSQIDLNLHALTSQDMIIGANGPPGTGKTFGLSTLAEILKAQGQAVRGVAFTGKAADTLEQEAGIKSNTIAKDLQLPGRTDWIVVDEASMIGSKDMHDILKRAEEEKSRVLIIGYTDQLPSISAGRMFKDLIEHGMSTIEIKEIIRQKDSTYKDIVQSLVARQVDDAFAKLADAGKIHEINDSTVRIAAIAKDYTDRPDWKNTIVLSSKNVDARELNAMIRSVLKERGEIGQQDHEITIRTPVPLSPIEQRFGQSYEPGQFVFARKAGVGGLRAGDEARVSAVDAAHKSLTIETGSGDSRVIDLIQDGGSLSVYEERRDNFSEREKIVFSKNDSKLKVRNGQMGEILKINEQGQMIIAMQDNSTRHVDPAIYQYVNHADAVTTYKAQGITQNNVIVNAPADGMQTFNAMYVQATRGKYDIQVYTDSTEKLVESVKIEQEKTSTLEKPTITEKPAGKLQDQEIEITQEHYGVIDARDQNEGREGKEKEPPGIRQREIEMEM
jgi:conjugative relaxase-like TrwC/TraI family protein